MSKKRTAEWVRFFQINRGGNRSFMGQLFLNAAGLFAMIFLGYFLKQLKVLSKADGSILSRMILNVTLPAAIILNLADMQIQMDALALILIAVIITFVQIMTAFFLTKKRMMCYVSFRCIVAPDSISEISRFLLHKVFIH